MRNRFISLLILFLNLLLPQAAQAEPPRVLASINPIHSLVAGVMEGVGEPGLIVEGNQSPHNFVLKPSQAKRIGQSDVIFIVDRNFELFLGSALDSLAPTAKLVELSTSPGIELLPVRNDEFVIDEAHGHEHEHHADGAKDYHIWLDATHAIHMVEVIAATLSSYDKPNAEKYEANADALKQKLAELDKNIKAQFSGATPNAGPAAPYAVYHDAYHYFERRYGLKAANRITQAPEYGSGFGAVNIVSQGIHSGRINCIFSEPQFKAAIVTRLAEATGAQIRVLNPDGSQFPVGKDMYFAMMQDIGNQFSECLSTHHDRPR